MSWIPNPNGAGKVWVDDGLPAQGGNPIPPSPTQQLQQSVMPQQPQWSPMLAANAPVSVDALLPQSQMPSLDMMTSMAEPQRQPAATPEARKVMAKQEERVQKQAQKEESDFAKKIRDYMSKREQIAMDSQARMDKLDSIYANQGKDITGFLQLADRVAGSFDPSGRTQAQGMGLAKQYAQGRMSEQQLLDLKNKIAMQQDKQYGSLTDDAANMERLRLQEKINQYRAQQQGKPITMQDEQRARQHFAQSKVKQQFDDDMKLMDVLQKYHTALRNSSGGELVGEKKAEIESLYNQVLVMVNSKQAELGALAGEDLNILRGILKPTTGLSGLGTEFFSGGKSTQQEAVRKLLNTGSSRMERTIKDTKDLYPYGVENSLESMSERLAPYKGGYSAPKKGGYDVANMTRAQKIAAARAKASGGM